VNKLTEDRVRHVLGPILGGGEWGKAVSIDDRLYVIDLGLVVEQPPDGARIANDIYREVIPRELTSIVQSNFNVQVPDKAFLLPDGRLDFRKMLDGFQRFYRRNAESWRERARYEEAAPQLLLQAWLQRVVNGGGFVEREYALGTGRADIYVRHFYQAGGKRAEQRFVVEIKVVHEHSSVETTVEEGLEQIARYADRCDPEEAHLVVFDPRDRDWDDKVYVKELVGAAPGGCPGREGRPITVWGM